MNDIIINSITSYLDILKSIFYWILAFSIMAGWGIYRGDKSINIGSFSIPTKVAYNYILGFYFVINLVVLIVFFRINELIVNFFSGNIKEIALIIKSYPWILNPFADYSNYLGLKGADPDWKNFDEIINYISNGFGCFCLMLIWWWAYIVLAFTHKEWERSNIIRTTEIVLAIFFILWLFLMFLIMKNLKYTNLFPYGLGVTTGFIFGFFSCLYLVFDFRMKQNNS